MKRLILCAIIGALLAGSSVLSLRYMRTSCDQLTGQLEKVVLQMQAGDKEKALAHYQELAALWEEKEPLLELMIRHQHLSCSSPRQTKSAFACGTSGRKRPFPWKTCCEKIGPQRSR